MNPTGVVGFAVSVYSFPVTEATLRLSEEVSVPVTIS